MCVACGLRLDRSSYIALDAAFHISHRVGSMSEGCPHTDVRDHTCRSEVGLAQQNKVEYEARRENLFSRGHFFFLSLKLRAQRSAII